MAEGVKMTGSPLLPAGKRVRPRANLDTSKPEDEALAAVGWQELGPVTKDEMERLATSAEAPPSQSDLESRPQVKTITTVDAAQLPPDKKSETEAALEAAVAFYRAQGETAGKSETAAKSDTSAETGASPRVTHCPHCSWPVDVPDVPAPSDADKLTYVQTMVGDVPFEKTYEFMGGAIQATFRTLMTGETDLPYQQAQQDLKQRRIETEVDYWATVNRYRFLLQLKTVVIRGKVPNIQRLPEGYNPQTSPHATSFWVEKELMEDIPEGETLLPKMAEWVAAKLFKHETVYRAVADGCSQFNRLVAKLEAEAPNPDFWPKTGTPT